MGSGMKIPIHEAIVFDLDSAGANSFLEKHTTCIFFVGEQFVDCFSIPLGLACRGENALLFQTSDNFPEAFSGFVLLENPCDYFGFFGVDDQRAVRGYIISVASALCHFGTAVLKAFPETGFNCFTFFKCVHRCISF